MKRFVCMLFTGMLLSGVLPLAAQESAGDLQEKLARLDAEIARRTLDLNYLTMECYIEYAGDNGVTVPVMTYPGLRYALVCDTVPSVRELHERFAAADKAYVDVLRTDPKYEAIHKEYVAINGLSDQKRKDANKEQYNLLYSRLRKNNKEYAPALEARREAMRIRNLGVLRFLLDHYRAQGIAMPTEPLFASYSKETRAMKAAYSEIGKIEYELTTLRRLRSELYEQMKREELGRPPKERVETPKLRIEE